MTYIWAYKVVLDLNDSKDPKEECGFIHAGDSFQSAIKMIEEYYEEELDKILWLECIQEGELITTVSEEAWNTIKNNLCWNSDLIYQ